MGPILRINVRVYISLYVKVGSAVTRMSKKVWKTILNKDFFTDFEAKSFYFIEANVLNVVDTVTIAD